MPVSTPSRTLFALLAATSGLFTTGCESLLFRYVNRSEAAPETSAVFAPDRQLALDVYRAQGTTGPAPTIVFFYGGGWKRGERAQYRFVGRRLAQAGWLTLVADYRTYPRAGFPAFMQDAADAVAWAKANASTHGGDPSRLYVMGHSAGAQIAGLLGADARYLQRVGLQPRQLSGVIGLSGPYDFNVGSEYAPIFGPPAQWPQAQTINFVDGDEPPFLLMHGTADKVVEARDSIELDAKLKSNGIASTLVLLPDTGHSAPLAGLYRDERAPAVMPALVDFIDGK